MDYHGLNHPFVYTFISQQQVYLFIDGNRTARRNPPPKHWGLRTYNFNFYNLACHT